MRAGIIAAGWGERLGQSIPKALTPVGGKLLIDHVLDGLEEAGAESVTCIVNEAAGEVPAHVTQSGRTLPIDWVIQTTPSSMHSFLIVLEHLSAQGSGPFLITTVDSIAQAGAYQQFVASARLFPEADVVLGLTGLIEDEKPLRVAMRGAEGTGVMPDHIRDNPEAFEIVALTNTGFDSALVTCGFYWVTGRILQEKESALAQKNPALRSYLGHLLKYGYKFYGAPLPPIVDIDRPEDVQSAEKLLCR